MAQMFARGFTLGAAGLLALAACSSPDEPDERVYYCGAQQIKVTPGEERVTLEYGDQQHQLRAIESASGARYVNDDEEYQLSFWSRGQRARFEVNGQDFPECRQAGAIIEPFSARGNEPFWRVDIENDEALLQRMGEDEHMYVIASQQLNDQRTEIRSEDDEFKLTVSESLCQDSMSGMYYPQSVTLELGNESLRGCGGDSAHLLQGVEWQVLALDDKDYSDEDVSIRFTHDDSREPQVVGRSACNRYFGRYDLTGESLNVGQIAGTKMACADATMRIEYEFLDALGKTRGFSVERENDNAAVVYLHTSEGRLRLEQD